jgi:hypothetical protein
MQSFANIMLLLKVSKDDSVPLPQRERLRGEGAVHDAGVPKRGRLQIARARHVLRYRISHSRPVGSET